MDAAPPPDPPFSQGLQALWAMAEGERVFDVLIVGSGYGGSIAAQAFAGAVHAESSRKLSVCLLERGREYLPGDFPSNLSQWPGHARFTREANGNVTGRADGLFDIRLGEDVMTLVASGVGGGSLINAGVLLEPDPPPPANDPMREPLRKHVEKLQTAKYFERARSVLGGVAFDDVVAKGEALSSLAADAQAVEKACITVASGSVPNPQGTRLNECKRCGDCMTGCNVGAKNSLEAGPLAAAHASGALRLYTGASVLSLQRDESKAVSGGTFASSGLWKVQVVHTDPVLQSREADPLPVWANKVVLAAGTLGSTEILLRARTERLVLSPMLGRGFSGNGDNLAAISGFGTPVHGVVRENEKPRAVGPTITRSMKLASGTRVQEFAVPGAMRWIYGEAVTTALALKSLLKTDRARHDGKAGPDPLAVQPDVIDRTLLVGLIGHDEGDGVVQLTSAEWPADRPPRQGGVRVHWPQARHGLALRKARDELAEWVRAANRRRSAKSDLTLLDNPLWRLLPDGLEVMTGQPVGPVLTVHPLGGCPLGANPSEAVVDAENGAVFNAVAADGKAGWYGSLAVLDGAAFGGSLGVNPALSITAHALYCCEKLAALWTVTLAAAHQPAASAPTAVARRFAPRQASPWPDAPEPVRTTRIQIVERLTGEVQVGGRPLMAEMTLSYGACDLHGLMRYGARMRVEPERSTVRWFDSGDYTSLALRHESEATRDSHEIGRMAIDGALVVLAREPSCRWQRTGRALRAYVCNRFLHDLVDVGSVGRAWAAVSGALKLASHAGEVRRLSYVLRLTGGWQAGSAAARFAAPVAALEKIGTLPSADRGRRVAGLKRLTYGVAANPWKQLTELEMTSFPAAPVTGTFHVDLAFFARQGQPLLRIVEQQDQVRTLTDLASFGLYLARLLVNLHLWTFRKPDDPENPALEPEPDYDCGPIEGGPDPEVTHLFVGSSRYTGEPVRVRLTRYRPATTGRAQGQPLVMIHGYSASGNTFTHRTLKPSAAGHFRAQGFDVWVVDLRSSSALPTCVSPWSMEEIALIDIPAALCHVRQVTGRPVDVLAHCIGAVMLGMAILTDARDVRNGTVKLGVDTFLSPAQLGRLNAFNGIGSSLATHPTLRRVVLSQKGPVLRYTDDNILRAWVMQFVRRWLLSGVYRFKPERRPTPGAQLLDRLLASLPYPYADWRRENPFWPVRTPWTAMRHRMDALYGRAFEAANLSDETLASLPDLFGLVHLDTVAQTMHFARAQAATTQRGDAEFVTVGRMRDRWGKIPTLSIHGNKNGLADPSTQLLQQAFFPPDVLEVVCAASTEPFARLGHQDLLIGRDSASVFERIEEFLLPAAKAASPAPSVAAPTSVPPLSRAPWVGPRILVEPGTPDRLRVIARGENSQGPGRLVLVPLLRDAVAESWRKHPTAPAFCSESVSMHHWAEIVLDAQDLNVTLDPAAETPAAWWVLMLHDHDDALAIATDAGPKTIVSAGTNAGPAMDAMRPGHGYRPIGPMPRATDRPLKGELDADVAASLIERLGVEPIASRPTPPTPAAAARHRLAPEHVPALPLAQYVAEFSDRILLRRTLERALSGAAPTPDRAATGLRFALASCLYPPGIADRQVALRQLEHLTLVAERGELDLVVMAGDSIYADATAGLVDPSRRDERFDQPWSRMLRGTSMQRLLRSVPVHMLADDHELEDNHEPPTEAAARRRPEEVRTLYERRVNAWRAWQTWSLGRNLDPEPRDAEAPGAQQLRQRLMDSRVGDRAFTCRGAPFYLLDTRFGRWPRDTGQVGRIIRDSQFQDLDAWLDATKAVPGARFVCTPSLLLPRRRSVANDPSIAGASDAWDGYPASMAALFRLLLTKGAGNVVFLSGDEHHALMAEVDVTSGKDNRSVRLLSIHTAALHAPFPFANGHPRDLQGLDATDTFPLEDLTVKVQAVSISTLDGYVTIDSEPGRLGIRFHRDGDTKWHRDYDARTLRLSS